MKCESVRSSIERQNVSKRQTRTVRMEPLLIRVTMLVMYVCVSEYVSALQIPF